MIKPADKKSIIFLMILFGKGLTLNLAHGVEYFTGLADEGVTWHSGGVATLVGLPKD